MSYSVGSVVVVDRLYGCLAVVEALATKGVACVAKCKANRPSWLFKGYLHKFLRDDNLQVIYL